MKPTDTLPEVIRTSQGLRDALFDELDSLRGGKSNPQKASAVAKISMQIVNTVRLEIDHHKHVLSLPTDGKTRSGTQAITKPAVLSLGEA
jgi:hypothetical protein